MTDSSMPWPRPLVILMSEIFPLESMTTSRMTSPRVPLGRVERSGLGVGKKVARAMLMLPEPRASAPEVESGWSETGDWVLGEFLVFLAMVGSGDSASACLGVVRVSGVVVWAGARPGR